MRPAPDATLRDGRYRLERGLGAGGMASVWLARDERLARPVAVKVVADTLADDPQWLKRFKREARVAAAISHPNIVRVFDYGVEGGRPYLVMEYIPGPNLAERLADPDEPRLDAASLARELLAALACVHDAGIVHRDIKAANVLLDPQGHVHLTDFGIAQPEDATSLTETGIVIGTRKYLAPEVAEGEPATVLSDLYCAGVVVREVAGEAASPGIAALIAALTAPDPQKRPSSASAALRLLETAPPQRTSPEGGAATAQARVIASTATTWPAQTAATLAQAGTATAGEGEARTANRLALTSGWLREQGVPPAFAVAGMLALLLVILVVALRAGGDSSPPATSTDGSASAPARPSATLDEQLRALDRIIDHAAGR